MSEEVEVNKEPMTLQELLMNIDNKLTLTIQLLITQQEFLQQLVHNSKAVWTPKKDLILPQ